MLRILIISVILLLSSRLVFAEQSLKQENMQKMMEKRQQERQGREQRELERLKKTSPELYKQRKDSQDRSAKISAILSSFRQKKISDSEAERQLYPLVKQGMQGQIDHLGQTIERLEKRLKSLKEAKQDPDSLIKKGVDQMLGKSMPSPDELLY